MTRLNRAFRKAALARQRKLALVTLLGGHCEQCGYDRCLAALDFDHIDPSTKTGNIATLISNNTWDACLVEAMKCRLLCANCHREKTWVREGV